MHCSFNRREAAGPLVPTVPRGNAYRTPTAALLSRQPVTPTRDLPPGEKPLPLRRTRPAPFPPLHGAALDTGLHPPRIRPDTPRFPPLPVRERQPGDLRLYNSREPFPHGRAKPRPGEQHGPVQVVHRKGLDRLAVREEGPSDPGPAAVRIPTGDRGNESAPHHAPDAGAPCRRAGSGTLPHFVGERRFAAPQRAVHQCSERMGAAHNTRKPRRLPRTSGRSPSRTAERAYSGLKIQDPPRTTRRSPLAGPLGFFTGWSLSTFR